MYYATTVCRSTTWGGTTMREEVNLKKKKTKNKKNQQKQMGLKSCAGELKKIVAVLQIDYKAPL